MTRNVTSPHFKSLFLSGLGLLALTSGCSTLLPKDTQQAQVHLQMATNHFNQRQYGKAIEEIHETLKIDPEMPAAYNHLALIYLETRRYEKSMEAFQKALQFKPIYPEVFNNIGVLLNRQEKYRQAITYFKRAAEVDSYLTPENALTNMGYAYYKLGDLDQALRSHQKAVDIAPMFCLANKNMGDVYAKKKNYKKAAEYFGKSVTHCPLYQEGRYKLALVNMKLGNKRQAKNHFERLIEHHKDGPYVDRSNEVLKFLR